MSEHRMLPGVESGDGSIPSLEARALTVRRGTLTIIRHLTWSHRAGRIAWLTGPNGAGKSSLIRVLAGLAAPVGGCVERRGAGGAIGYYHPRMSLPPDASAASFLSLSKRLAGEAPLAPERPVGRKRVRSLSTGEEKRLLLGCILARGRPFLFLDEPFEHLSPEGRAALGAALADAARRSVVVVATNQDLLPGEAPAIRMQIGGTEVVA